MPPPNPSVIDRLSAALADRYRVERELGQGGMATVFLAEDLRHGREVAIKVLHEDLGATLGSDRFLSEIKTTARLQHPHILPLLDSGSADGLLYYVMPFVAGESLRDRLEREKQLPIGDAVRIAREIADALALAHGHGIIHRDIKPENILLQGGHALVADFGIALAVQQAGGSRLTQTGLSLGTPQYMAPEQAMGEKSVDARADVYALGAVTYEMLVGEPPFTGATVQAIVARVLSSEPERPRTIRKTVPEHVEGAVLTALAKLPADRFAGVAAFASALEGATPLASSPARSRAGGPIPSLRSVAFVAFGVLIGAALSYAAARERPATTGTDVARSYVEQPAAEALPAGTSDFVLSPDGRDLVYVGPGETPGTVQLWHKRRTELHAVRLPGTTGAWGPFFSPDGKSLAFFRKGSLRRTSLAGGSPTTIATNLPANEGRGAWLDDGRIIFGNRTSLAIVRATGGEVTTIARNSEFIGYNPVLVQPLPESRGVVVQACPTQCPRAVIYAVDANLGKPRLIVTDGRSPAWLPTGHLAYITSAGRLVVAPFDPQTMQVTGEAVGLIENVSAFTVSQQGHLLYREGRLGQATRPVWVDRTGQASSLDSSLIAQVSSFSLSPSGRQLALSIVGDNEQHIWLKDLSTRALTKLTSGAMNHFRPSWSSDGAVIRFVQGDSTFGIAEKNVDGSGEDRALLSRNQLVETASSPDGQWMVFRTGGTDTSRAILAKRVGDSTLRRVDGPLDYKLGLAISPDSRYISYTSSASGRAEIYVSPFPDMTSSRWQVSQSGGLESRWSKDGTELFYVDEADNLMVASVTTQPRFAIKGTTRLFAADGYSRDGGFHMYEPAPDGRRFLMLAIESFPGKLVQVDGWFAEVLARVKEESR